MRPAFTLVELLVAIVVLTVGLLALAASAGIVASHVGDGGRLTATAQVARSVLDSISAAPCDAIVGGVSRRAGIEAAWIASRDSVATRIELTVSSVMRRGTRRDTYRQVAPCTR
jgi:prepilin-type N-terminal cleavage/methylation domain-containing protein